MQGILCGLGGRARSWIDVSNRKGIALAAFVEPSEEQVEIMLQHHEIPKDQIFKSLGEAIENSDTQFVMDVTPPHIHELVAMEAFGAGLHVISEKPLSDDLEAAKQVVRAAKDAGVVHMIAQNYRFGEMPRTTRRLVDEGVIGEPEQVIISFFMNWADNPGSHYVTQPFMLIKDMGVHHFDLMRYVLNRDAVNVLAHSWNPTWGWHQGHASHTAIFEMSGGLVATHHALGCSKGHNTTYNADWHIAGPEGSITWEGSQIFVSHGHKTEKQGQRYEVEHDTLPEGGQDAIITEFFSAIEDGRQPECNCEDNLKSLAMTFAVVKSSQEKRTVEMAELLG